MIIKAKNFSGKLDLSTKERLQESNLFEKEPLRLTISAGQSIEIDDKYYTIDNIQSALKAGYIEILDYNQQDVFSQEIKTPESTTTNYHLTKVEILNRADYPQDAFEKYNANLDVIDASLGSGSNATWGTITGTISSQFDLQNALDAKVDVTTNVNGHALSGDIVLTKTDIGLSNVANVDTTTTANITDSSGKRFVTDADILVLANTSGINTGNQDLSGLVPKTTNVNSHPLTGDIILTKYDIDLGNVANVDTTTTANITGSSNKRFVTDADILVLANTSGINTGNQDLSGLVPKTTNVNSHPLTGDIILTKYDIDLGSVANADTTTTVNIIDSTNKRFVTDADILVLANTSGINTGNQDLSGLVTKTTNVNSHPLTGDIILTKYDIDLGNVANVDTTTTANITDSSGKRFVTDADILVLANTSGINTGNQDLSGYANLSGATFIGEVNVANNVIAFAFYGDGSNLTGVSGEWDTYGTHTGNTNIIGSLAVGNVNSTGTVTCDIIIAASGNFSSDVIVSDSVNATGVVYSENQQVVTSDTIHEIISLTETEYTNIASPDNNTFYIITDATEQGPIIYPIKAVNADYAINTTDYTIVAYVPSTLTLPTANISGGQVFNIKNYSIGAVNVAAASGEIIDDQASITLSTKYETVTLQCANSTAWVKI